MNPSVWLKSQNCPGSGNDIVWPGKDAARELETDWSTSNGGNPK
jgi:hypothetical protein